MTRRFFSILILIPLISLSFACDRISDNGNAAPTAPLIIAAREGKADLVRAIVSSNDVNVNVTDAQGNTALIEAARFGHNDVARALIEHGADVKTRNKGGDTALMLAVKNSHDDVVRILKEAGAKE